MLHFHENRNLWTASVSSLKFSSINEEFEAAQQRLQKLAKNPGNEAKLKLYGLFKQSTVGPVNTKRPGITDFVGRAKWDAWNGLNGMSQVWFPIYRHVHYSINNINDRMKLRKNM